MKTLALILVPVVFGSATALAQNSVSISGGVAVPLGETGTSVSSGYNATVALNSKPPLASVGIRLEGMFNSFSFKTNGPGFTDQRIMAATANATITNAETPLRTFYVIGGIGAYRTQVIGPGAPTPNNDIGFNVGVGMNLTTGVGAFVEVRYHHVPSETTTMRFIPMTFGLRF